VGQGLHDEAIVLPPSGQLSQAAPKTIRICLLGSRRGGRGGEAVATNEASSEGGCAKFPPEAAAGTRKFFPLTKAEVGGRLTDTQSEPCSRHHPAFELPKRPKRKGFHEGFFFWCTKLYEVL